MQPSLDHQNPARDGSVLLRSLLDAATRRRTGELVVVVETREFHVYFREGLIAWAADSAEPAQFSRVIKQVCRIDDGAFSEVINECRRSRLPLGETLVSLGMARPEQVREALQAQARRVLEVVAGLVGGVSMFLERPTYLTYRFDYAFSIEELLPAPPPAVPSAAPLEEAAKPSPGLVEALGRLRAVSWVATYDDTRLLEHRGEPVGELEALLSINRALTAARTDFFAFRGHHGALVGARCSASAWACCRVNRAGALAQVTSVFAAHALTPALGQEPGPAPAPVWCTGSASPLLSVLEETLQLASELSAIFVEAGAQGARWGVGRAASAEEIYQRIAAASPYLPLLSRLTDQDQGAVAGGCEHFVFSTPEGVLFGAREERAGRWVSAWTWAHRHCSIGLGLASLALVLRRTDVEMFK